MAAALGFRPILILCSAVQHDQIIDELDVARLEIHFQLESWIVRERLHRVEGLVVESGQARDRSETLGAANEFRHETGHNMPLPRKKDRHFVPGVLTVHDLVPPIETNGFSQDRCQLRALSNQRIPDRGRTGQSRRSTKTRAMKTEQADDLRADIRMKGECIG